MQCEQASELISLKQDVELTAEQEQALQQHLAVCPACRQLMTRMEYASMLMGGSRVLTPRMDFSKRVMLQVHRRNRQRAVWGSLGVFVLTSVLVGLLIFAPTVGPGVVDIGTPSLTGTFLDGVFRFAGIATTVASSLRGVTEGVLSGSGGILVLVLAGGGAFLTALWFNALKLVSDRRR